MEKETIEKNKYLNLLKQEAVEVVGCTEPAAIAYSFAVIKKFCPEIIINPNKIKAKLSAGKDILRNADTAGIPRLKIRGNKVVAAMGIFSENPQFNVFSKITKKQIENVEHLLKRKNWLEIKPLNRKDFFIKSELIIDENICQTVISGSHNNLVLFKVNGKTLFSKKTEKKYEIKSIKEIIDLAKQRNKDIEEFARQILSTNGKLFDKLKIDDVSEGIARLIEHRMSGDYLSICAITGSGNQGLFLSLPFYKLYKEKGDKILSAFAVSLFTQIFLTQKKGLLSKQCGLSEKAALALSAGFLFLQNKKTEEIEEKIKYIFEMMHGLICEGAKESCADKGYMCMHNVFRRIYN